MSGPLHNLPPGRGDVQNLIQHLSDTIGNDVMKAMDSVGWEHTSNAPGVPTSPGVPTDAPLADNPQVTQSSEPTPASVPTTLDWEQFREPNGLILGKYKDGTAAAKGMHSLLHTAKAALSERDQAKAEAEQLRQRLMTPTPVGPSQTETKRITRSPKLDAIYEKAQKGEDIHTDDIAMLIQGVEEQSELRARQIVEEVEQARNKEQDGWAKVDAYFAMNHPDALNFVDEMRLFAQTNQEVGRIYNRLMATGDENAKVDASLYLWEKFSQQTATPVMPANVVLTENKLLANQQLRKELVEQERRDAGLLGTSASGVHQTSQQTGPTQEEINEAIARKVYDNGESWRKLTIHPTLNHPLFDS